MLLDYKKPTEVLYRSKSPVLEPDESYENEGFKTGVVYSCGAVIVENDLLVYYGGADSYVCVARVNLEEFLHNLMCDKILTIFFIRRCPSILLRLLA